MALLRVSFLTSSSVVLVFPLRKHFSAFSSAMLFFSAASALAALLLAPSAATASPSTSALSARQYQDPNSPLLVDSPACTFYRCIVTWKHGSTVNINWINAPKGTVNLVMMTDDNNSVAYQIANVSSPSQPGYCDAGSGLGVVVAGKPCGRYEFVVPTEWTVGRNCKHAFGAAFLCQGTRLLTMYASACEYNRTPLQTASGHSSLAQKVLNRSPTSFSSKPPMAILSHLPP